METILIMETVLIALGYITVVLVGVATSYLSKEKKIISLIVIGIGGGIFVFSQGHWIGILSWASYLFVFFSVMWMSKVQAKEILEKKSLGELMYHLTKDANGEIKVHSARLRVIK
jgi:hypothetical protein